MKKIVTLLSIILTGCGFSKEKIEALPDAKLNTPYSTTVNFSDQRTFKESLVFEIIPADSGLSIKSADDEMYDTAIISGTPKVKQDISVKIHYAIMGPVGFFEDKIRDNQYLIKVKE